MAEVHDLAKERFLTPEEVGSLLRRDVKWVYANSLPERGLRPAGLLYPAARRFGRRLLLFERDTLERILVEAADTT